eukprot:CAMPEP_0174350972 /NCGR_PEP_ID=MMETSP0811_2-20130205/8190_1 /TAXON_ID=73025 ORGANISM="Eutreptiella gymnastica-like, Strain CCMP1594" /NCGR_SAMPLE_ID=MMETSP0811_2 /ASSEMBLY_ACC=CAM_ASM_000667 /LENGTH=37 /DNA_ID= /DNA_START= /DNA_END= /DNA_ORIENTATION=
MTRRDGELAAGNLVEVPRFRVVNLAAKVNRQFDLAPP